MKELRILFFPQTGNLKGGPANVVGYLSQNLRDCVDISYYPIFSENKSQGYLNYAQRLFQIWSNLQKNFDIAHFVISPSFQNASIITPILAKVNNLPVILNIHGIIQMERAFREVEISGIQSVLEIAASLISRETASRIIVNSKYTYENVVNLYNVDPKKVEVIPNGVNVSHFQNCTGNIFLDGDPCILYVGRLSYVKGVGTLIKAIAQVKHQLPNIKVHFVGDSKSTDPTLRAMIIEEGVEKNVDFLKWVSQSMLPCYYKAVDFCVFPSHLETFGIVILEAMASGTPIIASDIPPFVELLSEGKTGLFFKRGNASDLSRAILLLASNLKLRKQLSENSLVVVQDYDWSRIGKRYLDLYYRLNR